MDKHLIRDRWGKNVHDPYKECYNAFLLILSSW